MTAIRAVDHVAILVPSIAESVPLFCEALGGEFLSGGDNDETGIRLVHLRLAGFKLELLQPLRKDSFLQRHLDERGPGFHHLTFFVDDLQATVTDLGGAGFATTGADFSASVWKEAFLGPRSAFGALLQFVETTRAWGERERDITLSDVLDGRVVWRDYVPCIREETDGSPPPDPVIHPTNEPVHSVDNVPTDPAFPPAEGLLRSRRQAEILAAILTDPDVEFPLSGLARRLAIPYSSLHREIERAERYGIVKTRRFENLRLVRANVDSPYYTGLADLLRTASGSA